MAQTAGFWGLKKAGRAVRKKSSGGGSGIRTHGTLTRTTVFETAPFDRSGIPPQVEITVDSADSSRFIVTFCQGCLI